MYPWRAKHLGAGSKIRNLFLLNLQYYHPFHSGIPKFSNTNIPKMRCCQRKECDKEILKFGIILPIQFYPHCNIWLFRRPFHSGGACWNCLFMMCLHLTIAFFLGGQKVARFGKAMQFSSTAIFILLILHLHIHCELCEMLPPKPPSQSLSCSEDALIRQLL